MDRRRLSALAEVNAHHRNRDPPPGDHHPEDYHPDCGAPKKAELARVLLD
jgi:hypothetical protein